MGLSARLSVEFLTPTSHNGLSDSSIHSSTNQDIEESTKQVDTEMWKGGWRKKVRRCNRQVCNVMVLNRHVVWQRSRNIM